MKHLILEFIPGIYCLLMIFGTLYFYRKKLSRRRRQGDFRSPLPEDTKILRGPGESQKRQLEEFENGFYETVPFWSIFAFIVALFPMAASSWLHVDQARQITAIIASFLLLVFLSIIQVLWFSRSLSKIRNRRLGLFGERVVGEVLDGLKAEGFHVFHDLPTGDPKQPYNIDHVVVGPTGLFVIETKTYSKQKGYTQLDSHEVAFTGDRLVFPWGERHDELDQARKHAVNLTHEISSAIAEPIEATPILVLPGWFVKSDLAWPMVLNHKRVPAHILHQNGRRLSPKQIDQATQYLDSRCRDVEY